MGKLKQAIDAWHGQNSMKRKIAHPKATMSVPQIYDGE
jgi:hypothetical protein